MDTPLEEWLSSFEDGRFQLLIPWLKTSTWETVKQLKKEELRVLLPPECVLPVAQVIDIAVANSTSHESNSALARIEQKKGSSY
jgi:hypothetical protein